MTMMKPEWRRVRAGLWDYGKSISLVRQREWWEVWRYDEPPFGNYLARGFGLAAGKALAESLFDPRVEEICQGQREATP